MGMMVKSGMSASNLERRSGPPLAAGKCFAAGSSPEAPTT